MNIEYSISNNEALVKDENGNIKSRELYNNTSQILAMENIIEELENELKKIPKDEIVIERLKSRYYLKEALISEGLGILIYSVFFATILKESLLTNLKLLKLALGYVTIVSANLFFMEYANAKITQKQYKLEKYKESHLTTLLKNAQEKLEDLKKEAKKVESDLEETKQIDKSSLQALKNYLAYFNKLILKNKTYQRYYNKGILDQKLVEEYNGNESAIYLIKGYYEKNNN